MLHNLQLYVNSTILEHVNVYARGCFGEIQEDIANVWNVWLLDTETQFTRCVQVQINCKYAGIFVSLSSLPSLRV